VYGTSSTPPLPPVTFDESALILAEVIRTLADSGQVPQERVAPELISAAVDS
jgi:hypothetical protein